MDTGRYSCTARNEAGIADDFKDIDVLGNIFFWKISRNVSIKTCFSVPPVIRREGIDLNPRVPAGQTVTLHCEASGKPSPQLSWYKDDATLRPNDKIDIAPGGIYMQVHKTLAIKTDPSR